MSGMNKWDESGAINPLLLPFMAAILLLIAALAFGAWAYGGRQDYKNNVDAKIATAVATAQKAEDAVKEKQFAEREKNPLKIYRGPSEFGSITIQYPKTWSGYAAADGTASPYIDDYFAPDVVPSATADSSSFALRVQVVDDSYSSLLEGYANGNGDGSPAVTIQPYSAPKVPKVVGSRLEGSIFNNKTGSLVLLPLRDKTLEIWTEGNQYQADFNNIILPNLTFSP